MAGQTLSEVETAALEAVLAVLLPSATGPGAAEAGAADYVRARLEGPHADRIDDLRSVLRRAEVDPEAAVAELAASGDPRFAELRGLAWEGFLCDPARGGNRAGVGWERFGATARRKARG